MFFGTPGINVFLIIIIIIIIIVIIIISVCMFLIVLKNEVFLSVLVG